MAGSLWLLDMYLTFVIKANFLLFKPIYYMENKRLSLEDFKLKIDSNNDAIDIEKISGGILGACHDIAISSSAKFYFLGWDITWLCDSCN
jgi:hypothetical protein